MDQLLDSLPGEAVTPLFLKALGRGSLLKSDPPPPPHRVFESETLQWGLKICIYNKFQVRLMPLFWV